jgi:hypothetical protein
MRHIMAVMAMVVMCHVIYFHVTVNDLMWKWTYATHYGCDGDG